MSEKYAEIVLTNGSTTLVDNENYNYLNQWSWYEDNNGYVRRSDYSSGRCVTVLMHREITNAPEGKPVDHKSGNKKDNREKNLRVCTDSNNAMNRKKISNTSSKYKGVSFDKEYNKWRAYIKIDGKRKNLGRYNNEVEAARVYNEKALELFGQYAKLNDIDYEVLS